MCVTNRVWSGVFAVLAVSAIVAISAAPAMAVSYVKVLTWGEIKGTGGSRAHYGTVVDGDTAYNFLNLEDDGFPGDSGRITKVTNLGGTKTYTELLSTSAYRAIANTGSLTAWYGASQSGDCLQFGTTNTDSIFRVHKTTGVITEYVTEAEIRAHTGQASTMVLSAQTDGPDGEHYFYEGRSDSILKSTGVDASPVETYISDSELAAVADGSDTVSGGITFDSEGDLYWGNNSKDAMYKWDDSESSGSTMLTTVNITAVTGETSAGFGDIFCAPDGNVYFYESKSDGIMSFDPSDPSGTLAHAITEAELLAGPAGSDAVGELDWYNSNIAWSASLSPSSSSKGFYAVPEPGTLGLLATGALGALFVMLRYRRRNR